MINSLKSFSTHYLTEKANSFIDFNVRNIGFPTTIMLNSTDIESIYQFIDYIRQSYAEDLYLRACFSDQQYPHYFSLITSKKNVGDDIAALLTKLSDVGIRQFDLICQPLITKIDWSGAILKRNDMIYLEIVKGASLVLLREGEFLFGYFKNKDIEFFRKGNQKTVISIENRMIHKDDIDQNYIPYDELLNKYLYKLKTDRLCDGKLYEFGISDDNVCFFESKSIPSNAFTQIENIYWDKYVPLNGQAKEFTHKYDDDKEIIVITKPAFDFVKEPCCYKEKIVVLDSCPLLAHFTIWLIQNNVKCELHINRYDVIHC